MTSSAFYLSYTDAPAGIAWLEQLGFRTVARQDGPDGTVVHSELVRDGVVLMVATAAADYGRLPVRGVSVGQGLYLVSADVDDLAHRAVEAGGTLLVAPEDTGWGSRRARVLDPEGHEWSFGTYAPGAEV